MCNYDWMNVAVPCCARISALGWAWACKTRRVQGDVGAMKLPVFAQNFLWQSEKTSGLAAGSGTKTGGIPAQCLIARTCLVLCWHNDALLQHTKRKYPLHRHFRSVKSLRCTRCFCYTLPSHTGHPTLEASESLVCFRVLEMFRAMFTAILREV